MGTLASLSVAVLCGIGIWQIYGALTKGGHVVSATNGSSKTTAQARTPFGGIDWQVPASLDASSTSKNRADADGISNIGDNVVGALVDSYVTLQKSGVYTPDEGARVAENIAESLRAHVSFETYSAGDIKTDTDTSYDRMLRYRSDLRIALEPLLKNTAYELSLFASYIDTHDKTYIAGLKTAAGHYQDAVTNAANVVVPRDALSHHIGILNSLSEFGATISAMADNADDPFASAALLRTYNSAEAQMLTSFNTLAMYEKAKKP